MLYLVAHSFLNGQSKNSNLFPLPELDETQLKKKHRGALGTRMGKTLKTSAKLASTVCFPSDGTGNWPL